MSLYSIKRAEEVIAEYIPKEEYRQVLIQRLCHKTPYEEISGAVGYSPQWCKEIVKRYRNEILSLL